VENGYAQALDAAKRDLKFLLVILLSPEHDDTSSFVRQTLLDPSVQNYLSEQENGGHRQIHVWAGNVRDSEAYQVSAALNATKFPFSALICSTPQSEASTSVGSSMSIVARLTGPMPASQYLSKLQRAVSQYSPSLESARRKKAEVDSARNLREQQNSAYERSLAADRERARQKREAEEKRLAEEKAAIAAAEAASKYEDGLRRWKKWRASRLKPEPADGKDTVRISLRMPGGERLVRKFPSNAELEEVYAFVECHDVESDVDEAEPQGFKHEYGFRLVSPMPREVFDLQRGGTVGTRLGRSANLIVEALDTGEDGEGDDAV
jgi:FAS-associated factor 2